jgi:hypothetical protein
VIRGRVRCLWLHCRCVAELLGNEVSESVGGQSLTGPEKGRANRGKPEAREREVMHVAGRRHFNHLGKKIASRRARERVLRSDVAILST